MVRQALHVDVEGRFGDRETASQGLLLSLKREIMANAHFLLEAEGERETPAVLARCQDSA